MPAFERFDLNGRAATDREIARRWRAFRRQVRRTSSTPLARVLGPLLGQGTHRRQLAERLRPAMPVAPVASPREVAVFPLDYVPSSAGVRCSSDEVTRHVEFVSLESSDPGELLEKFEGALHSPKEWLLVVQHGAGDDAHLAAAGTLLTRSQGADVVFGDEVGDTASLPVLKPRLVGPHTMLSYNVPGRPALVRREAAVGAGGLRAEAGRAAEHDLYLRLTDARATFRHVAVVLAGRTPEERHHVDLAPDTQRVVTEALGRRGVTAHVARTSHPSVVRWSPVPPTWPSIDILIPTRDRLDLLRRCIESVEASSYPNVALTILDNDSVEPATRQYLDASAHRVVRCPGPFNYAAIINRGVEHCSAQYVLTLNNDTVVRTRDWLEQLVGVASLQDVGVVGATLLDERDQHEHDGVVIAPYPQHLRLGTNYLREDESMVARRDVAAVTGAVQLISRALYLDLGGMDERLAVVMNDVDLCLRSQADGRHVVMVPDVVVSHFAGSTRGRLDPLSDRNHFVRRWDVFGELHDPYFAESLRLFGASVRYQPTTRD